jgi:phosphatidylethanolamine/phosphatidyl-N-methylethanolamine N-methyltransferase
MSKSVGFLAERRLMWQAFRKDFFHTGSVIPSSRYLGRELAANLRGSRAPARILEIGAGTGPVTAQIIPYLIPGDQLDVVEINGDFIPLLQQRFPQVVKPDGREGEAPSEPRTMRSESPPYTMRLHHAPVQQVPGEGVYHHLISGLPFNNFPIKLVREIWQSIHRLAAPGATFSFFEYFAIREVKMPFTKGDERKRLHLVGRHLAREIRQHETHARKVFLNVPPAVVHHLRLKGTA